MWNLRILVADDDKTLCENIAKILKFDYYSVDSAFDGMEAKDLIDYYNYDLLVLDWMMPKALGIEVCQYARSKGFDGGILMLTAKDATENIIEGLDNGADDYMVKPFKMEELRARVRALLRRKNKIVEEEIIVGALKLNKNKRTVFIDNFEVSLTKNEFLLLEYLIENKGQVLTHEQVIDYVWDIDDNANTNTLAALVRLVRKKIDVEDEPSYIQSIRGLGYKLRDS
ncbi:response regulator transcription factor [Solibacillus silvestris]|uniref:response regulator transcription factor n=1 Tax=Solibacillus silvestris TaxID=76853 RepID=UPI003F81FBEE